MLSMLCLSWTLVGRNVQMFFLKITTLQNDETFRNVSMQYNKPQFNLIYRLQ